MRLARTGIIVVSGICVAIFLIAGLRSTLLTAVEFVTLPIGRTISPIVESLTRHWDERRSTTELRDRVAELERQIAALSVDYVKLRAFEEENISLRKQAKFLNDSGYDSVGARVISRTIDPIRSQILIDRGSTDGLEAGMAVLTDGGVFIGSITSIRGQTAVVTLLDDVNSRISGALTDGKTLIGVVEGLGNSVAKLEYVPQTVPLQHGDLIVTSGQEEKIPAALPLATVTRVDATPTDPFKTATIEFLVSARNVRLVNVLRASALHPSGHL